MKLKILLSAIFLLFAYTVASAEIFDDKHWEKYDLSENWLKKRLSADSKNLIKFYKERKAELTKVKIAALAVYNDNGGQEKCCYREGDNYPSRKRIVLLDVESLLNVPTELLGYGAFFNPFKDQIEIIKKGEEEWEAIFSNDGIGPMTIEYKKGWLYKARFSSSFSEVWVTYLITEKEVTLRLTVKNSEGKKIRDIIINKSD